MGREIFMEKISKALLYFLYGILFIFISLWIIDIIVLDDRIMEEILLWWKIM